ncbi:hypothetical protein [uncultured Roseovarius sp.]|uniref:alginate O-acetyltransferase AlgX-related protein n=1 Tax=uncultured Roseovarius sp. TaxID=293344 RepID=UPI00262EA03D|nr:hypothetical protein [uncultured Roseovarius sp.]
MAQHLIAFRNLLTALSFVVLITTPVLLHLTSGGSVDSKVENRRLSPAPALSQALTNWTTLPEETNAWMRDHFGLRRTYLKIGFQLDKVLRSSGSLNAVRGDDGWIFNALNGALALHQGLLPFSEGEADRWLDGLTLVQDTAEASGATFIAMIAPNKHTIFPEYLSGYPNKAAGESRLDEVLRLARTRKLPLFDLRDTLKEAKTHDKIYYETDSHWTEIGAYIGFSELRSALNARGANIPDIPRDALILSTDKDFRGDLYGLLGEENGVPETIQTVEIDQKQIGPKAGSILLIGDSFSNSLVKYLEATFESVTFTDNRSGEPDLSSIAEKRHDVVVYQVVERYLSRPFKPVIAQN